MKLNRKTMVKIGLFAFLYMGILYAVIMNGFGMNAKPYDRTFEGIEYRNDSAEYTVTTVHMEGKFSNPLIGKSRFVGDLTYKDRTYATSFDIKRDAFIDIYDEANYTGANATLGYLCTDSTMDSITILIMEYDDSYHKGWGSKDGLIFTGDAKTIEEARQLTIQNVEETVFGGVFE